VTASIWASLSSQTTSPTAPISAAELAYQSPEAAGRLREQVTSPGGTTAAALEVLMGEGGLADLMTRAVAAAAKRSKELAG
jgi:pyrroline-5-carboxylate reductase